MKTLINFIKLPVVYFLISFFISGCLISQIAPVDESAKSWIGLPVSRIEKAMEYPESYASRINWERSTYNLDNGNWVFIEPGIGT